MPERDDSGGLRFWHCTTVENGLRIMRDARMRVLGRTANWPPPNGCESVEIRFHYELLRTYLEQTPLASRMLMPRMPGVLQRR